MKLLISMISMSLLMGFTAKADYDFQLMDDSEATQDQIFKFPASMGTVSFNHTMHQGKFNCTACHPGVPEKYDPTVSIKDFAHSTCKTCHSEQGVDTSCKKCHKK